MTRAAGWVAAIALAALALLMAVSTSELVAFFREFTVAAECPAPAEPLQQRT